MRKLKKPLSLLLALVLVLGGAVLGSPEAAAEDLPYAEEMGLEFTEDTVLYAPFFSYIEKNGEYVPTVESLSFTSMGDMEYSIYSVSLSEPDEEGMVTLDILVTASGSSLLEMVRGYENDPQLNYHSWGNSFSFFDYYSGYTIPARDMEGDDSAESSVEFQVEGKIVPVSMAKSSEASSRWRFGSWSKYDTWQNELFFEISLNYSFRYPADYDGLCLALYKPGKTEYKELDTEEVPESEPLLVEDRTAEDYYCLRVTDLLAAFGS